MDSTTGENATSRQVRNVGGLKESGVKKKSGDYEREKARRPPFLLSLDHVGEKVMTYAAVVFQDLSSDRDETESERWSMREREPSSEECK